VTTLYPFAPSYSPYRPPWQQIVTLDGQQYTVTVGWNVYGQDWYFTLTALDGTQVVTRPLTGSPETVPLTSLVWAPNTPVLLGVTQVIPSPAQSAFGLAVATSSAPLWFPVGAVATLTVGSATPDDFCGTFACTVTGATTFTYPLTVNPPPTPVQGGSTYVAGGTDSWWSADLDLVAGYFQTSTLVYRPFSGNVETNP
jgi:hypothetical protein